MALGDAAINSKSGDETHAHKDVHLSLLDIVGGDHRDTKDKTVVAEMSDEELDQLLYAAFADLKKRDRLGPEFKGLEDGLKAASRGIALQMFVLGKPANDN